MGEEKAWKKIEETRKRATEINTLREQNEQKFAAKEQFYKAKWESIRSAQSQNQQNRDRAKAVREATQLGLMEARSNNAAQAKQESQQMLLHKKDDAKRKLEEDRLAQLEKFREDYEARAAQEELLRARTDALVAKMEKEEMELIQRLQNTQTVQRNAYEELEAALGQTSQQISTSTRHMGGGGPSGAGSRQGGGMPGTNG